MYFFVILQKISLSVQKYVSRYFFRMPRTTGHFLIPQKRYANAGFTLIEMIVAIALFAVVMLVSVSTLLSLVAASRKVQALELVMNNLNITLDSGIFNRRVDVVNLLKKEEDISITSAAIMGARFPYLSPAGRIANDYFVDGGYFDNSGAGVVQEMIRGIINIANEDSIKHGNLYKQIRKLHFKVLHIVNSPIDQDSSNIKRVPPIKNDLMAPILTIVGAYDMQTTVNDGRLINYIHDINDYSNNKADYTQISLYKNEAEFKSDPLHRRFAKDPPYAMNWFMSDTTLDRINVRLNENTSLASLIKGIISRKDTVR